MLLLWPFGRCSRSASARCSACGIGLGREPAALRPVQVAQPTRAVVIDLERHWRTRMRRRA